MFVKNSTADGFSVKAWQGDAKTLLAFNFSDKNAATNLAGFTIRVQPHGQPAYYLLNKLVLPPGKHAVLAEEPPNSTANAPIQKFRWLHVPGALHDGDTVFYGVYTYTITPRYFNKGALTALDLSKSVSVDIQVQPFTTKQVELGFTRGFTQSQAFIHHFGVNALFRPAGKDLLFDTKGIAGQNAAGQSYTFEQEYEWSGFTARGKIFAILNEVLADSSLSLDVFAYDLNEPDVMKAFLQLASEGRIRIILDNASLHHKPGAREDAFEQLFRKAMTGNANILRGKFGRFSHDKVFIVYKNNNAIKVLTGSTNFSVTGMYVNSNHVIIFNNVDVADLYAKIFDESWNDNVSIKFTGSSLSEQSFAFNQKGLPNMSITFAPHTAQVAQSNLDAIAQRVTGSASSVLFAVMDLSAQGPVPDALKQIHQNQEIFSYGISDSPGNAIALYKPGTKEGILVGGLPGQTLLPPPFDQEKAIGIGHQVHHKFVICDFNTSNTMMWCGSSNLALDGDNLIQIKDIDIATVFAIEAISLVDHFDFRDAHSSHTATPAQAPKAPKRGGKTAAQHMAAQQAALKAAHTKHPVGNTPAGEPATGGAPAGGTPAALQLYDNDSWAQRYFDENDLYNSDRVLFG